MAQQSGITPKGEATDPEIATLRQDGDSDVTLILKKGKFAEFLFGFLGARETLSKTFDNDFIVRIEDLLQFHHLLEQKIAKEQFIMTSLVTAVIRYDDNTNRTINTFEAIEKYSEHRDIGVQSFDMCWNFVFKTPDMNTVQQQKVSVFFETARLFSRVGSITVRVEHTNQVWAAEVLRLFEEHIGKIVIRYSLAYKTLRSLKSFGILDTIAVACILFIIVGGIYMLIQKKDMLNPLKVRDEFIFDVAEVLIDNRSDRDPSLLLQFFLLRDLKYEPRAIISGLQEAGRFNSKYHGVIDKWVSGYYDRDEKSEKLTYNTKAMIQQIQAMQNIHWAYSYFRFVLLYLVAYMLTALYLRVFRMQSILALTAKGNRQMEKQEKEKSIMMQFIFGICASIVAAIIYEYTIKLFLIN